MTRQEIADSYLFKALESPFGIVLETDNVSVTHHYLMNGRRANHQYSCLRFCRSPNSPREIWIVKNAEAA